MLITRPLDRRCRFFLSPGGLATERDPFFVPSPSFPEGNELISNNRANVFPSDIMGYFGP
jgi:hypothetical protein